MVQIVPSVVRFTIEGTLLGVPCISTLDQFLAEDDLNTRTEACENGAKLMLRAWHDWILPKLTPSYSFTAVSWVDLSDTTGSTGRVTESSTRVLPKPGEYSGGDPYTPMAAMLVSKNAAANRGQRAGRMFLAPPNEPHVAEGLIVPTLQTGMATALAGFLDVLKQDTPTTYPVVTHFKGSNPVGTFSPILNFSLRRRLATQRRRNR